MGALRAVHRRRRRSPDVAPHAPIARDTSRRFRERSLAPGPRRHVRRIGMGTMPRKRKPEDAGVPAPPRATAGAEPYGQLVTGISGLVDEARRVVVRSTSSVIVSTYWEIGRRIVEFEQEGRAGRLRRRTAAAAGERSCAAARAWVLGPQSLQNESFLCQSSDFAVTEGKITTRCRTVS